MKLTYSSKGLERICTEAEAAIRKYGVRMAVRIHGCIKQIAAADNVQILINGHIGRCHSLSHDRKGQYAMDLIHPYRLVFSVKGESVQTARIIEVTDYH